MFKINSLKGLKIILLFALINSSFYMIFSPTGFVKLFIALLMNIAGIVLVIFFLKFVSQKQQVSPYFKFLVFVLILWSLYIVVQSLSLNSKNLMTLFGNYLMGWAWLTPLAIVFGLNINNWISLFDFFGKLLFAGSILSLGSFLYSPDTVFGLLEWFSFLPILLFSFYYQNNKMKKIIIFSVLAYFILTYFASQRANVVFIVIIFSFVIFEFFRQDMIKRKKKVLFSLIGSLFVLLLLVQSVSIYTSFLNNKDVTADSRTFLFIELFSDMSTRDLITGRGALGQYYSPYFASLKKLHIAGGDAAMRSVNEIGYLQVILKGGFIMLGLYLLVLLPAAYLGIFRSKNIIARMCGYFILSYLLLWIVSYYPVFSTEYILLWMAAGTVLSSKNRNITNTELLLRTRRGWRYAKQRK